MTIFEKIKAAWALKGFAEKEYQEAIMQTSSGRPGWKTTEFWMNVGTQVGVLYGAVHGFIPAPWNVVIPVAGTAIYTICATVRKAVSDIQAARSSGSPVATETATATATVSTK